MPGGGCETDPQTPIYLRQEKRPDSVLASPINYDLEFEPNLKNFTFAGRETLTATAAKPTDRISVHAAELKIKSCHLVTGKSKTRAGTELDEKSEQLHITLPSKVRGKFVLEIRFAGVLNDRLLGFYRSRYRVGSKTKYLATTQFEAADARRAFPCWDEPEAKATFDIAITAESNYTAVSNMPEVSKKRLGGKTRHRFGTTPVMSTYLVYLGVGEFEHISGRSGKTRVRVITTRGNKSRGRFALELGKRLLASYEEYFGIRYPLPKLDLLAIPDFAAGAMENWGAITFRETILLYDPKTSSTRTKQFIAEVVSHEIAHQWFGNLVTMRWWNDLWLNESFATFMATKFVDRFHPEWDLWDQFVEDAMNTAMGLDSLKSTHPIDVKVSSPAEIREIFDAISYDKGGCILRMLERYVGESSFRRGLRSYLSKFRYRNAVGDDLWSAIGRASGKPVKSVVNSWLRQPGFPVLEVSQDGARVRLRQKRFLLEPDKKHEKGLWQIPVDVSAGGRSQTHLLTSRSKNIRVPRGSVLVVNRGRSGFYRTRYDDGILLDLKMLVDGKRIPHIDRWAIQNDLFALCVSGDDTVGSYLDFSDAYFDEDSYLVSVNVAANLYSLFLMTYWEPSSEAIRGHAMNYFRHLLHRLGWDPKRSDRHTDALLRSFAISALARLGDEQVTGEAESRFGKFLKKPGSLPPDLREAVFSAVAWNGDSRTHSQLTSLFKGAGTQEEKLRFLGALCGFRDERLLAKTLDFSQTPNVRSQNMQLPIMRVAANPHGREILWPWLAKNWAKLSKKVGHGNPLFNRIVASIGQVADAKMEKEIRLFFKRNPTPGTERTLEQTMERVRIRSRFLASVKKELGNG